jgi:hypothetical protein
LPERNDFQIVVSDLAMGENAIERHQLPPNFGSHAMTTNCN